MLIDEPAVLVPRRLAQALLGLAVPEAQRRVQRGQALDDDIKRLLSDLVRAAREDSRFRSGSDPGSDRFRNAIVDGVTTGTAAQRLGISQRAVIKRIAAGTLRAEQQASGTWIVDLEGAAP